jgi:hypothetical protein
MVRRENTSRLNLEGWQAIVIILYTAKCYHLPLVVAHSPVLSVMHRLIPSIIHCSIRIHVVSIKSKTPPSNDPYP